MSPAFAYFNPVRLLFGPGTVAEIGVQTRRLGVRALLVTTGDTFRKNGLLARVEGLLAASGVSTLVHSAVTPNPTCGEIDAGAAIARAERTEVVIGLGGGSAMDAAKGIAVAAGHGKPIWSYADPAERVGLGELMLPVVAVPTTAGTGAEVTQYIVVTNPQTRQKPGIGSELTFARTAIVDPELSAGMPPALTVASGVDVLAHAIEAYASVRSTRITDLYCEEALRLAGAHLRRAVGHGGDVAARAAMSLAATLAGYAIAHCRTTVCHALAHAAGGIKDATTHGELLAAMTPAAMRYSMESRPEKYRRLASLLEGDGPAGRPSLEAGVAAVERLFGDIGANRGLASLGITERDHAAIVEGATTYMKGPLEADPAEVTAEGLLGILRASHSQAGA